MRMILFAIMALLLCSAPFIYAAEAEDDELDVVQIESEKEITDESIRDALNSYGTWINDRDLGLVWQPAEVAVSRDWKPYCDNGHWVLTNFGWYWKSDYEWGNITFHYGRWCRHSKLVWVWVPGHRWGTAWGHWRKCGHRTEWAPICPKVRIEIGIGKVSNKCKPRPKPDAHREKPSQRHLKDGRR